MNSITKESINVMSLAGFVKMINENAWTFRTAPDVVFINNRHFGKWHFVRNSRPAVISNVSEQTAWKIADSSGLY